MSNPSITADKTPWYQWDTGLTVTVSGGEMNECHFANRKQGTAYVQAVINGIARVPDELLQVAAPIKAYGYVSDGAGGQTYVEQTFEVIARNIPADYTYTKTAQKTIRDAEVARDEAVQAAKDAKASELAADDSAVEASNSAQSAGESASAAATSASNAAKSAGDAAKSASDAKAAASNTVEDASALLKTYTDNAKTSADNAATSASNAADAASAASRSASAAEQSATDASNAKVAAQTAKAEAEAAKSEAATSASNAATSATAAAKSASDAAASVGAINVISPNNVELPSENTGGEYTIAIGKQGKVTSSYSIIIGASAIADGEPGAIAIGTSSEAHSARSVAIGAGSVATKELEFSVGNESRLREITHVSTPTADTSTSTKKYTDDNDAKTLNEAKKYTDDNTSNALVGTVSGKLLHVEDAWPSKPLSVTIDGAYKQDGTPSPDNPVPITVIENPVLHVLGSNGIDIDTAYYRSVSGNPKAERINTGFVFTATNNDERFVRVKANLVVGATMIIDYDYTIVSGTATRIAVYNSSAKQYFNRGKPFTVTEYLSDIDFYIDTDMTVNALVTNVRLSYVNTSNYAPYNFTSLPITLPPEHPYLAKLPDGTCDTIEIDKDGNASLVARVKRMTLSKFAYSSLLDCIDIYEPANVNNHVSGFRINDFNAPNKRRVVCSELPSLYDSWNTAKIGVDWVDGLICRYSWDVLGIVDGDSISVRIEKLKAYAQNKVDVQIYYPIKTHVTYSLGKLDIPALPETISNVWTDAELTTNMSMAYKRDINIAFENLAQAVVAAAAGE